MLGTRRFPFDPSINVTELYKTNDQRHCSSRPQPQSCPTFLQHPGNVTIAACGLHSDRCMVPHRHASNMPPGHESCSKFHLDSVHALQVLHASTRFRISMVCTPLRLLRSAWHRTARRLDWAWFSARMPPWLWNPRITSEKHTQTSGQMHASKITARTQSLTMPRDYHLEPGQVSLTMPATGGIPIYHTMQTYVQTGSCIHDPHAHAHDAGHTTWNHPGPLSPP